MINAKYWSVENRNKSIRGRFKILNGFEFIYIAFEEAIFWGRLKTSNFTRRKFEQVLQLWLYLLQVDSNCTGKKVVRRARAPERSERARASRIVGLAGNCISFRAKNTAGRSQMGLPCNMTLTIDTSLKNIDFKTMNRNANWNVIVPNRMLYWPSLILVIFSSVVSAPKETAAIPFRRTAATWSLIKDNGGTMTRQTE